MAGTGRKLEEKAVFSNRNDHDYADTMEIAPGVPWEMEEAVDTVHRIGRKDGNRTRQVIMQFSKRIYRDQIWALSKESTVCKEVGCHFAEDLNKEDRRGEATALATR
ncbi:Deleted in malignant brain tumors 1 protein [Labeo rohita]|uniref:Deleted in malignant brain tumors 1 protein n=1 Tax=Labeo rohita TaxID=84645 RepID=A0ABQ8L8Q0_LABRO|nr:Deleted in malignant brain tumors 1 protein [Labeo rohita]